MLLFQNKMRLLIDFTYMYMCNLLIYYGSYSYICALDDCWRSSTTCYWRFHPPMDNKIYSHVSCYSSIEDYVNIGGILSFYELVL